MRVKQEEWVKWLKRDNDGFALYPYRPSEIALKEDAPQQIIDEYNKMLAERKKYL